MKTVGIYGGTPVFDMAGQNWADLWSSAMWKALFVVQRRCLTASVPLVIQIQTGDMCVCLYMRACGKLS